VEETQGPKGRANSTIDPVAMALAPSGASCEKADAFLDEQRHHLCEQFKYLGKQLRLGLWEERLGLLLRLATAFAGLAIAGGLACLVWDASQSKGLLIEPFSVPPDLAQRGMMGQVIAAELLDRRFALGATEAGFFPMMLLYRSCWFPKARTQQIRAEIGEPMNRFSAAALQTISHAMDLPSHFVMPPFTWLGSSKKLDLMLLTTR
jgi:hypothetical protein